MRGDVVRILYDATKDNVEYVLGKTVERFEQDDRKVLAHFSDGTSDTFDLLVGADGQGSRIRKGILPPDAVDPYLRMGIHMAYWCRYFSALHGRAGEHNQRRIKVDHRP